MPDGREGKGGVRIRGVAEGVQIPYYFCQIFTQQKDLVMRIASFVTVLGLGLAALPAHASDTVEHYDAKSSDSLASALATLADYNARVATVMARDDLSVQDMEEVHEYTYTMEEAVARIASEMAEIAVVLEEVHQASEGDDPGALRAATAAYLEQSAPLAE
jgi:hypothetical protein